MVAPLQELREKVNKVNLVGKHYRCNFKVNGVEWTLILVDPEDDRLILDEVHYEGMTNYRLREIYINNSIFTREDFVKGVIKHEITHATIECTRHYATDLFNHEQVCEFMAYHSENIVASTNTIMKEIKLNASKEGVISETVGAN